MPSRLITNFSLIIFAIAAIMALFKYTDVFDIGITASLDEGCRSLVRIIREEKPETRLSETEKEKIIKTLDKSDEHAELFCSSAYFPLVPGSSWTYQVTSGGDKDVVRIGVPSSENGITFLDGQLLSRKNWTNRTLVSCRDNKIYVTDWNFLLVFAGDRTVTTPCRENQYNFSFPRDRDLVKGTAWNESGCLKYTILDENYRDKQAEFTENIEVKGRVLGQENITVPGGTFTAIKVGLEISGKQDLNGNTKAVNSTIDYWISQGVGIVKIVYRDISNNKPTVEQELSGLQIPTEKNYKSNAR